MNRSIAMMISLLIIASAIGMIGHRLIDAAAGQAGSLTSLEAGDNVGGLIGSRLEVPQS